MSAISVLKLDLELTNHAFQKTSDTKTQDSSVDKGLPLSRCKNNEQAAEKIVCRSDVATFTKLTQTTKMKMFQFDQDFLMPI